MWRARPLAIEFRWAEGRNDQLPAFAGDLASRQVEVIFAGGPPAARAAKAATTKIPVVFTSGDDPVRIGLVSSLNRPGANVTGVSLLFGEAQAKRLELLRDLIPSVRAVGLLFDPDAFREDVETAARNLNLQLYAVPVAAEDQLDAAFASFANHRVNAILVGTSPRLTAWSTQIIRLVARASLPAIYEVRGFVTDGGLMSYGASVEDGYRQAGIYVARILNGDKPSDLPVVQPTKFELVINMQTAKSLGLEIPQTLLARADEVIE
jgi:putative ABC transport system substrate-binding protein